MEAERSISNVKSMPGKAVIPRMAIIGSPLVVFVIGPHLRVKSEDIIPSNHVQACGIYNGLNKTEQMLCLNNQ